MNTILPQSGGKSAHVTGHYGEQRKNGPHKGVDFNYHGGQTGINLSNPKVHSPVDGTVEFVGGNYGTISIRDADKNLHQILHTNSQSVQAGQKVSVGNPIGTMGNKGPKGSKYDQHVHYQIKDSKGKIINPEYYWDNQAENNSGKSAQAPAKKGQPKGTADQPTQSAKPITTSDTYEVKSGDTLGKITQKHGTTVEDIMQANPGITNPNAIKVGQKIKIPGKEKVAAASAPKSGGSGANILINGLTAVHAASQGILTTIDVCWTKIGKPVVPIPYTNVARSADAAKTASTVFINGNPVCHQKSIISKSAGDEPGSRKGVVSGTIKGKAEFVTGSPNVLIEGIPAVRQNDMMVSNNGNTAPMPLSQPGAPRAKEVKTEKIEELDETALPNEVPLTVSGGALHTQHDLVGYSINVSDGSQQTQQQQKLGPPQKAALPEPGKAALPKAEKAALPEPGEAKPILTKVTYSSQLPASEQIVSPYVISIIQLALQKADMPQAVITSTIRTPKEQARIMYNNAKQDLTKQFQLYGSTGDEVLKVYKDNQSSSESEVIKLMEDKITTLLDQGRRTSKHVVTVDQYNDCNIIDIGANSTRNVCGKAFSVEKFTKALEDLQANGYIDQLIDETDKTNSCWHIEIKPNAKPLINN
jgi:LysM repeat protein